MKRVSFRNIVSLGIHLILCGMAGLQPSLTAAAEYVLLRGQGVVVTADDVLADVERAPADMRADILANPEKVERLALNVYVRRVLATRGREAGVLNDPKVMAAQQVASDRVLSDAYIAKIAADAMPVDGEALDALARSTYAAGDLASFKVEERRVRHILIAHKTKDAKARAEEVLAKLKNGADFAALAKEYSDDPVSRQKGGDLGLFPRGRMVPAFEAAAFGLAKPGDLAGPVETDFGFHILRLEEIRLPDKRTYEQVSDEIKRDLRAKFGDQKRVELVTAIQSAPVDIDRKTIESFARQKR